MKTCGKCGTEQVLDNFRRNARSKDGKQAWCKSCVSAYDRERYLTTDRPDQAKANNARSRERNIAWFENYMLDKSCADCGNSDRRVLQFDHRDRVTKSGHVGDFVYRAYSLERIQEEIAKCDIRCANCHMIRTGEQLGWRTAMLATIE